MEVLKYKQFEFKIKTTASNDFLLSHKDVSNAFYIYESLLSETIYLNPSLLYENTHYIRLGEDVFWTKKGIVRAGIIIGCDESIEFANMME